MKIKILLASAMAMSLLAGAASAATATFQFDVDAQAFKSKNKYEGTFDQVYAVGGDQSLTSDGDGTNVLDATAAGTFEGNIKNGVEVNASATSIDLSTGATVSADPFMDGISGGKLSGLGVCSSGTDVGGFSDCSSLNPDNTTPADDSTGDDNLYSPEHLKLTFSGVGNDYTITDLLIRDKDHNLITANDAIIINGTSYNTTNGVVDLGGGISGTMFGFTSGAADKEIYLSVLSVAAVPLPAAGLLLLGGLGGLAALKRRKKA